jgi:UMF1 family MFS transporter
LMAKLAPPELATQFFGLFALSATVTAFLAPLLVAITTDLFDSQRIGFGSLSILMIIGAILLMRVKEEQATVAPNDN